MVGPLSQVFKQAAKLPKEEQEALAAIIAEELQDEERWNAKFAASHDKLRRLADAARAEQAAGTVCRMRA